MTPYQAKRTDANHAQFLKALRQFQRPHVDLSRLGGGCPDILALIKGVWCLIEVKDGSKPPSARKLTPAQKLFHDDVKAAGGIIYTMKSIDELFALIGARRAA